MDRLTLQELAAVLAKKNSMEKKEAEKFAAALFETIREGLNTEDAVKIKGFGTFKIIDVEARESVNVNTGERVLINGHRKITFTPDATMKELVNKPFSGFETVILNEGVTFDEPDNDVEEPETEPTEEAPAETGEQEEVVEVAAEDVVSETEEEEKTILIAEETVPEEKEETVPEVEETAPEVEEETVPVVEEETVPEEEETVPTEEETTPRRRWPWIVAVVVCSALSFAAGYLVASQKAEPATDAKQETVEPAAKDTAKTVALRADTVVAAEVKDSVETTEVAETEVKDPSADLADRYDAMDTRVRLGAYRIVGVAETVKARQGDNTARLAKRYLGPDMACYIEAVNGISSNTPIAEGEEIKIPKLQLRKRKK